MDNVASLMSAISDLYRATLTGDHRMYANHVDKIIRCVGDVGNRLNELEKRVQQLEHKS